jgi:hypothetical protein
MNSYPAHRIVELIQQVVARRAFKQLDETSQADLAYIKLYAENIAKEIEREAAGAAPRRGVRGDPQ